MGVSIQRCMRVATSNLFDTMILVRQNHQWKQ
nr:MAG TPA_asm: hypothetical protein [Caudoviricetes sp.]DAV59285.1 MAG TPA: hypothetical protein [Caudoviricetes sp.]